MKTKNPLSSLFWTSTFVLLFSGVLLTETIGFIRLDYHSFANFISELGAENADHALIINLFGFLPVALSSAIAILCLSVRFNGNTLAKTGLVLWVFGLSFGYLSAFFFPCDYGCPIDGSSRQIIHNLSGLVAYPAGTLGLVLLALGLNQDPTKALSKLVFLVAIVTAIGFVMMLIPEQENLRGFWQRSADYSMFALIVILGWFVPHQSR